MENPEKIKVFVSYARADLDFADQLVIALARLGHEPIIDRHGISGGEDWRERLHELILQADSVVFAVSPTSITSDICDWEINETIRLGKRLIPIICQDVEGLDVPENLQDLNYIFFYANPDFPGTGFGKGLVDLDTALRTDLDWFREQTRLAELAERWDQRGREEDLLLRGTELKHYQDWLRTKPASAPDLTDLQRAFLEESDRLELVRNNTQLQQIEARQKAVKNLRNVTLGGLAAVVVLMIASLTMGFFAVQNTAQLDVRTSQFFTQTAKQARAQDGYKESLFDLVHAVSTAKRSLFSDYTNKEAEALLVDSYLNSPYRNGYLWEMPDIILSVPLGDTGNIYMMMPDPEDPGAIVGQVVHVETGEVLKTVQRISLENLLNEEDTGLPPSALVQELGRLSDDPLIRALFMAVSQSGEEFAVVSYDDVTDTVVWSLVDSVSGDTRTVLGSRPRGSNVLRFLPTYSADDAYLFLDNDEGFDVFDVASGDLVLSYVGENEPAPTYIRYERSVFDTDGRFVPLEIVDREREIVTTVLHDLVGDQHVTLAEYTTTKSDIQGRPRWYALDSINKKWIRCYEEQFCDIGTFGNESEVELTGLPEVAYFMQFAGDGKKVLTLGDNANINLWDAVTGENLLSFSPETPDDYSNSELYSFASGQQSLIEFNRYPGQEFYLLDYSNNRLDLLYTNDSNRYVSVVYDSLSDRYLVHSDGELAVLTPMPQDTKVIQNDLISRSSGSVQATSSGEQVAVRNEGRIHLLDTTTGRTVRRIPDGTREAESLIPLANEGLLINMRENDGTTSTTYWQKPELNQYFVGESGVFEIRNTQEGVRRQFLLSPADDYYLIFSDPERAPTVTLNMRDLETHELLHAFRIADLIGDDATEISWDDQVTFSPDGKSLLATIRFNQAKRINGVSRNLRFTKFLYFDIEQKHAEVLELNSATNDAGEFSFSSSDFHPSTDKTVFYQSKRSSSQGARKIEIFRIDTAAKTFEFLYELPRLGRRDIRFMIEDGRSLALIVKEKDAELIDAASGEVLKKLTDYLNDAQLAELHKYEFELDNDFEGVLFGYEGKNEIDGAIYVWDFRSDQVISYTELLRMIVLRYRDEGETLPNHRLLLKNGPGNEYVVYNVLTNEIDGVLDVSLAGNHKRTLTQDSRFLILYDSEHIFYYDLETYQMVYRLPHLMDNFSSARLIVSAKSNYLIETRHTPYWFHKIEPLVYESPETWFTAACDALPPAELLEYMKENQISQNPCF